MTSSGRSAPAAVIAPQPSRLGTALEARQVGPILLLLTTIAGALYILLTWRFAVRKLMWNDELYTFYVARLPTLSEVWRALSTGGEQTPPLFYAITRASIALFGSGGLAFRLPEIIGFALMGVCLYVFVRRRTAYAPALLAATMPLVTTAYRYAFEARSYGIELGVVALSLVCWQSVAMGRARRIWVPALAAALAAALSIHYYGIFVIIPMAFAEVVRTFERRKVDLPVWTAFVVAVIPLLLQLPILRAGAGYAGTFWSPPQWVNLPDFYEELLSPAVVPATAILLLALASSLFVHSSPVRELTHRTLPLSELALTAGVAAVPLFAVIAAKLVTGAFVNRYALFAVVGLAALVGFGSHVGFRRASQLQVLAVAIVLGWFGLSSTRELLGPTGMSMPVSRIAIDRPAEWVAAAGHADLPVVVADPHSFIVLSHYAAPELRQRIVYLADPERALRRLGHNSVERGMLDLLQPWFGMHVERFDPYLADRSSFFVYGDFVRLSFLNWLLPELQERRYHLELLDRAGDNMLFLASRDAHG